MTKEDYVIVCGDFGGVWSFEKEDKEEKHLLDWLEEKTIYDAVRGWEPRKF